MAIEITDEAIAAQRAYDAADAKVRQLVEQQPSGVAIAAGEASISDEQREEVRLARDARLAALHVLRAERAKLGGGNAVVVEMALRKAARGEDAPAE